VANPENVGFAMFELAERRGNEIALTDASEHLTWAEVAVKVNAAADTLLEFGFGARRLAVIGSNCSETVIVYAAALVAGVGTILVNYQSTAEEVEYLSVDGGASAIWSSPEYLSVAQVAADRIGIPVLSIPGPHISTSRIEQTPVGSPPLNRSATTDLIYTSGTTGRPKGVEVPPIAISTVGDRLAIMERHHMNGLGPHLVSGPLYHSGPHGAISLLLTGNPVTLVGRFEAGAVLDAIEADRIATSVMVPTHLVRLLTLPEEKRQRADVSSLRMIGLTGSICPVEVKKAIIDWFGPVLREAYGGSETPIISFIMSDEWLEHPGSVGRPSAPFRVLVLDENGSPCPPGQDGQLYFEDESGRGIRYYNDPEKTAAAHLRPGVFTLGDIGHVDTEGYLFITGRVTDMVISGGVNIYPAECERVLYTHPAVKDVALFGQPIDEMGERLVGVVAVSDPAVTTSDLIDYCRKSIAPYKVPKQLVLVTEVPRSPMGKVDKLAAKRAFAELTEAQ
jgi:long-chain acyl-CoA synthetase